MFHILGFLFIIIIAILIIGLSIIGTVIRSIFGLGRHRTSSGSYQNPEGYSYNNTNTRQRSTSSSQQDETTEPEEGEIHLKRKKLFSKDEGEYVEFEEIKE